MEITVSTQELILGNLLLLFVLKIVVFILGYLTIKLGAALLREGVKGEFKFKSELHGFGADLQSGSPGLLFVLLGIGLIGFAMAYNKEIPYSKQTSTYTNETKKKDTTTTTPGPGPFDSTENKKK
jgi:hypothetical protein